MRIVGAILAVFVVWGVCDFVIHGVILKETYEQTAQFWRPMAEMRMGLMRLVTLISAAAFVLIYAKFVSEKSLKRAVLYGLLMGVGYGVSMGYGTYAVMPIPYKLAFVWCHGTLIECVLGGLVTGLIVKN